MSKRYTEGIMADGACILDNGKLINITEILNILNEKDKWIDINDRRPEKSGRYLIFDIFGNIKIINFSEFSMTFPVQNILKWMHLRDI